MKLLIFFVMILMMNQPAVANEPLRPWQSIKRASIQKCLSSPLPMRIEGQVSYVQLPIGLKAAPVSAWFLVDTGSTQSSVDPKALTEEASPVGALVNAARTYHPESFEFFGEWDHLSFRIHDYSQISASVRQAGIIGTDFLSKQPYIFDYQERLLYRSEGPLSCSSEDLTQAGLVALSTLGYYSDLSAQSGSGTRISAPNVPTIPVQIGSESFVAQIDSGYDDSKYPFSININQLLKDALDRAGVPLIAIPQLNSTLSTCVSGVSDQITAYQLGEGANFSFVDVNGQAVNEYPQVNLFLKNTPEAAKICGGISTWSKPAAQLGASFLKNAGFVIFDPHTSQVWLPRTE